MKSKEILLLISSILLTGFALNFIWESYHSVFFYTCCTNMSAPEHLKLMSYVSTIDALLILVGYLLVSSKSGLTWIKEKNRNNYIAFSIISLFFAVWIEYRGVYLLEKWSYNTFMPKLLGFGLSPLIQLILTGLLTFFIVNKLLLSSNKTKV